MPPCLPTVAWCAGLTRVGNEALLGGRRPAFLSKELSSEEWCSGSQSLIISPARQQLSFIRWTGGHSVVSPSPPAFCFALFHSEHCCARVRAGVPAVPDCREISENSQINAAGEDSAVGVENPIEGECRPN